MSRVVVALGLLALLAVGFPAEAADPVNCNPEKGMVDLDRCTPPKPAYDPFADKKVTCWEMKRYPDLIFTGSIDLGTGGISPIDVDYSCKEGLAALPFLQKLGTLTEIVRSEPSGMCGGSIVHMHWRHYQFALLEAGFAPSKLPVRQAEAQQLANLYPQAIDSNVREYFERWSYESLYNFELYQAYMAEVAIATPLLAQHYQRVFRYSKDRALELTRRAMAIYVDRAAGTFPAASIDETRRILDMARLAKGSLAELQAALDGGLGEEDIQTALSVALLLQRPAAHIALLAGRAASLDYGGESALFFALRDQGNVRFLLDRGSDVNYQNGFGKTSLFYAIGFNDRQLVELLLDRGADVNHRYRANLKTSEFDCKYNIRPARTPLMHAAQHADVSMLELLLRRGARLRDVDGMGESATAYALRADRQPNSAYLKRLGLVAPDLERKIKSDKMRLKCLDEGIRRGLKGKEFDRLLATCYQPEKSN